MTAPQANYVVDTQGQKIFVQISVQEWEAFVKEFERMKALLYMKTKLKNAFREVRQIQQGKRKGTPLSDFLNEL